MHLKKLSLIASAISLAGCPMRPPIADINSFTKANGNNSNGLIVFEQFEDGPMEFWLSAKRLADGKVILFSRGGGAKEEHPNKSFRLDSKYEAADTGYHNPRMYEAKEGQYVIYQAALRGPEINSQIEANFNLVPDTFSVVKGKATYIGSFNLYADRGIPLISPQKISMRTADKSAIIDSLLAKKKISVIRDLIDVKKN